MSKRYSMLMAVGAILIISALSLQLFNIWDDQRAREASALNVDAMVKNIAQLPSDVDSNLDLDNDMKTMLVDENEYIGIISIPEIDIMLPVFSTWSYQLLKNAPCLYSGNYKENSMVIAAHNYSSHFGKLSDLKSGTLVRFTSSDGVLYEYVVSQIEVLNSFDVEKMTKSNSDLTLFTCTYSGEKRVTVRCVVK